MVAIVSLFLVILFSLVINRIAAEALILTGISADVARFQARSAFCGAGFTTGESESVVNHPIRRRIVYMLMLMGNAGIVTAISSLVLTFANIQDSDTFFSRFGVVVATLLLLWWIAASRWLKNWMTRIIRKTLARLTSLDLQDYTSLLHVGGGYKIMEMRVQDDSPLADRTLFHIPLKKHGVQVLGIQKKGRDYEGTPDGDSRIEKGDILTLYGKSSVFDDPNWCEQMRCS